MDSHPVSMGGERPKILQVATEDCTARFRRCNYDSIDGRSLLRERLQGPGTTRQALRKFLDDVAGLEKAVDLCIGSGSAGRGLDEDNSRYDRRPQPVALENCDQGGCVGGSASEAGEPTGVEHHAPHALRLAGCSSRIRRAKASARAIAFAEGSPASSINSARYRSVSSSSCCRRSSARTAD